jgi:hypothetical protein
VLSDADNVSTSKMFDKSVMDPEKALELLQNTEEGRAMIRSEHQNNSTMINEEEDEEIFGDFRFRTFRQHKSIKEEYDFLKFEDPEDMPKISVEKFMSKAKVEKDSIELVSMDIEECEN